MGDGGRVREREREREKKGGREGGNEREREGEREGGRERERERMRESRKMTSRLARSPLHVRRWRVDNKPVRKIMDLIECLKKEGLRDRGR